MSAERKRTPVDPKQQQPQNDSHFWWGSWSRRSIHTLDTRTRLMYTQPLSAVSLIHSSRDIAAGAELNSSRRPPRQVTSPPIRSHSVTRSPDAGAADATATNPAGSCYCTCPPDQGFGVCLNVPAGTAPAVRGDCTTVPGWNDKATSPLWKATDVCPVSRLAAVGDVSLGALCRRCAVCASRPSMMTHQKGTWY